jgi:hypothetical protein
VDSQAVAVAVCVAVFESVTSHPNTVSQVREVEVKVVEVMVPATVAEKKVVVEQIEALSVVHSSGSGAKDTCPPGRIVNLGQGGSLPSTFHPGGHSIPGGYRRCRD